MRRSSGATSSCGAISFETNIPYKFRAQNGVGWSDVDLCVLHPRTGDAAAVEVKGWHTGRTTPSYLRAYPSLFHFTRAEATAAVSALLGREDFRHILVVGRLSDRSREEVLAYARERGVEMIEFPSILAELIVDTPVKRSAGSDAEHMIRVLKAYRLVSSDSTGS